MGRMIDVGRICMKTAGRESGKFCVVLDVLEDGFVLVTGPKAATTVKRRKCSIKHVEPTPETVKIKKNASDDDVLAEYKKAGLFKKLDVKEPSAKDVEKAKEAERKRLAGLRKEKPKKAEKKEEKVPEKPPEEKKEEPKPEEPEKEKPKPKHEKKPEPKAEKKEAKPKKEKKAKPKAKKPEKKPAAKKGEPKKAAKKKK
jgi:large subunit ribosomal protein L14e